MVDCPVCLGEGLHDHRDSDAWFGENFSDEQLAEMRERGFVHPVGVVSCGECEGTGFVSDERARDIRAVAVAYVDQVIAKVADDERNAHENTDLS
jgi:hypothetical protein